MARILYVTTDISWPLSFGGEIRRWNVLQGLKLAGTTDVLAFRNLASPRSAQAFEGCGLVYEIPRAHLDPSPARERQYQSTLGRGMIALGSLRPYEYSGSDLKGLRHAVLERIRPEDYDIVCFATGRTAYPLRDLFRPDRSILDGDDFSYVRNFGLLRSSPWYGAKVWDYVDVLKMCRMERAFNRQFRYVIRCSEEDRARHPASNVAVIPNGTVIPDPAERTPGNTALFVGDLGYAPNRLGIEWFLDFVWPAIVTRIPDATLRIIGRNPSARIAGSDGHQGISVLGFVPSLSEHYAAASVAVVPLHAGGGTRLKILEALAHSVPVASTTIGAFGIDAAEEHGLYRADDPTAFATLCASMMGESLERAGRAAGCGREYVRERYDWVAIRRQVAALATKVLEGKDP